MTSKEQSAAFLRPFKAIVPIPLWCGLRIKNKIPEESYEQTNDDQTAVERKATAEKRKAKTFLLLGLPQKIAQQDFVGRGGATEQNVRQRLRCCTGSEVCADEEV